MQSMYQLDRKMTAAWLAWNKAQEAADRAKAEYDNLYSDWKKRLAQDEQKRSRRPALTGTTASQHQNHNEPGRHEIL